MLKPTAIALSMSIATAPAFAQSAKPESAANPCMVARVGLLDAQFESSPINNTKGKSTAQIKKAIQAAKAQVAKECRTSALHVPYKTANLTATFS